MDYIYKKATADTPIPLPRCPFCAAEPHFVLDRDQVRRGIQCSVCFACVPPLYMSESEALVLWNRRSGGDG